MNPAPFRLAREAFLRFPSRLVNFFFRFSENFFSASPEACRRRKIRFYENFASPVKTFFQFRDTFASLAVRLNRRRRTLRRCPPFVKLFVESFLFFLIEGGRGTLSLARKGFPFPPQTPPYPSQTRFILASVTARRCRGFPLFAVPRRLGKGEELEAKNLSGSPFPSPFYSPKPKSPLCQHSAQGRWEKSLSVEE